MNCPLLFVLFLWQSSWPISSAKFFFLVVWWKHKKRLSVSTIYLSFPLVFGWNLLYLVHEHSCWCCSDILYVIFRLFLAKGISEPFCSAACASALLKLCEDAATPMYEHSSLEILLWVGEVCPINCMVYQNIYTWRSLVFVQVILYCSIIFK